MQILTDAILSTFAYSDETFDIVRLSDAFGISESDFIKFCKAKGYLQLCQEELNAKDIIFLAYSVTNTNVKWANKEAVAKCLTKSAFEQIISETESAEDDSINPNSLEARIIAKNEELTEFKATASNLTNRLTEACDRIDNLKAKVKRLTTILLKVKRLINL